MKHNTIKVGRSNVRIAVGRFPTRSDFVVDAMVGPRKVAIRSWMAKATKTAAPKKPRAKSADAEL